MSVWGFIAFIHDSPLPIRHCPRHRQGMTIPIVMALLLIIGIFAIAVNLLTRGQQAMGAHAWNAETSWQLALASGRTTIRHFARRLSDPADGLQLELRDCSTAQLELPGVYTEDIPDLKMFMADYPDVDLRLHARLERLQSPAGSGGAGEKIGEIVVTARVALRGAVKRVTLRRPFRLVNVLPLPMARFTLFLKESPGERLNVLSSKLDGNTQRGHPLVLSHGDNDVERNGWTWLGDGRTVLHIARGGRNFGEDAQLPDAVTRSLFFPDQSYALLQLNSGFWDEAANEDVFKGFPDHSGFRSSLLRIFGCPAIGDRPSLTRVFGDVWRRYLQAAAISPVRDGELVQVVPLPWTVRQKEQPRDAGVPPFLYLSPKLYQVYMSQIREEPINRSYDFLASGGETPPPLLLKSASEGRWREVYPLNDTDLELGLAEGRPVWNGNLKNVQYGGDLVHRSGYRFARVEEMIAACRVAEGEDHLRINGVVHIAEEKADLRRYSPLRIRGQALIVCEQDVALGDIGPEEPGRDFVVVVSRNGSIYTGNSPVEAGLVALQGEVRFDEAKIRGFLATGSLDPDHIRRGGSIEYVVPRDRDGFPRVELLTLDLAPVLSGCREEWP